MYFSGGVQKHPDKRIVNTKKAETVFFLSIPPVPTHSGHLITVHSFFEQTFLQWLRYARHGLSFGDIVSQKTDKVPTFWNI